MTRHWEPPSQAYCHTADFVHNFNTFEKHANLWDTNSLFLSSKKKSSKQGQKFKVRAKGGLLSRVCFQRVGQSRLIPQMKVITILDDIHELQSKFYT